MRQRRPHHRVTVTLLALVVPLLAGARATAQSARVPDPISSGIAERYAKRLGLSDSQRSALLGVHARYRDEYAALRKGAIAAYHEANSDYRSWSATPEEAQASVKSLQSVMDSVRRVDAGLFDAMVPILTDDQAEGLQQLRLAREREGLLSVFPMVRFHVPAAAVDLGAILDDLDLAEAPREAVAPIIQQYEREMAAAARRVFEAGANQIIERAEMQIRFRAEQQELVATMMPAPENVEAAPAEGDDSGAPATRPDPPSPEEQERLTREREERSAELRKRSQELQQRQMEAYFDGEGKVARIAVTMGAVNRRTVRQLTAVLPEDSDRTLYERYVRAGYRELPKLPGPAARLFDEALSNEKLDDSARESLREQRATAAASTGAIIEQMIDAVDEYRSSGGRMWRANTEDPADEAFDRRMKHLRERWRGANNDAIAAAAETVPSYAERASALHQQPPGDGGNDLSMVIVMVNDFPGMGTSLMVQGQRLRIPPDQLEAVFGKTHGIGPIGKETLDHYVRVLEVSDDERVVLDALYDDYRTRYAATAAAAAAQAATAQRELWGVDEDSQVQVPAEADLERARTLERQSAYAIRAADEQFFADVRVAVVDEPRQPRVERLRLARERDRNPGGLDGDSRGFIIIGGRPRSMGARGFTNSPEADLALDSLTSDIDLEDAERNEIESILATYVGAGATHARTRQAASLRIQAALEQTVLESWDGAQMQPGAIGDDSPYIKTRDAQGKTATAAREAMVALNRETLEELRGVLTPDAAERLRRAYRRAVYPLVYADDSSAEMIIGTALELEDLTDEQRAAMAEIATEYRQAYEGMSDDLVEIAKADAANDPFDFSDQEGMRKRMEAMQERQRRAKQLRFDRSDLSERAHNRIRLLLTETQRELVDQTLKEAKAKKALSESFAR